MTVLRIVLAALATYRLTRLAVEDTLLDEPRDALAGWLDDRRHPKLAELVSCPWCASFWVAIVVVAAAYQLDGIWFDAPAVVLACSAVTGLLASWE